MILAVENGSKIVANHNPPMNQVVESTLTHSRDAADTWNMSCNWDVSFLYRFCIDFAMVAEVVIHGAAAALRQSGAGPMDVQAQRVQRAQRHRFGGLLTSHD